MFGKARILTTGIIATTFCLAGCKMGSSNSASLNTPTGATGSNKVSLHGSQVPAEQFQLIAANLNSSPGPLQNDQTMIADANQPAVTPTGTDIIEPGGTVDPFATDPTTAFGLQGDAYIQKCKAAGVPIPPAWGDAAWKPVKTLTSGRIFALDPSLTTTLYSYQDSTVKGTCAALPRMNGTTIAALGIICQSATGKACFWDNKERAISIDNDGNRFQQTIGDASRIRPEIIANGDNLVENCSSCHRGSNVFILHHDDLQALPNSDASATFEPIAQTGWSNKVLDENLIPQCGQCHSKSDGNELGKLDFAYCSTVMLPSIESTRLSWNEQTQQTSEVDIHAGKGAPMPPDGEVAADYAKDIAYIKAECRKAYDAAKQWWNWK